MAQGAVHWGIWSRVMTVALAGLVSTELRAEPVRFRVAYVGSYQDLKVYGSSDIHASQASSSRAFRPWGAEALVVGAISPGANWEIHTRAQKGRLRFSAFTFEQEFWDVIGGLGLRAGAARGRWGALWMSAGARWRSWMMTTGLYPTNHQLGGYLGLTYGLGPFELEAEAGLMPIGFGTTSLGVQRDSSTLHLTARYRIPMDRWAFVPGLEYFRTRRSYYASMIDVSKQSFFVDDIRAGVFLGAEF